MPAPSGSGSTDLPHLAPPGRRPPGSNEQGAGGQAPARPDQRLPLVGSPSADGSISRTSARPPRGLARDRRAGRTRVSLTTSTSPGREQGGEVGHRGVAAPAGPADDAGADEQPGGAPRLDRLLGDGRVGQPVVVGVHRGRAVDTAPWLADGAAATGSRCSRRPDVRQSVGRRRPDGSEQRGLDRSRARGGPRPGARPPAPGACAGAGPAGAGRARRRPRWCRAPRRCTGPAW